MNRFILFQSFDALANGPVIAEAFCRKWRELSAIPIRLRPSLVLEWATSPDCCGVVVPVGSRSMLDHIERLTCPVINYSEHLPPLPGAVNLRYDSEEIGEIAADHLCEQGFHHFAFLDHPRSDFAKNRQAGFRKALMKKGLKLDSVFAFDPPPLPDSEYKPAFVRAVEQWLSPLPKSLGILAANDTIAREYYWALQALQPDWFALQALVGIDDNYPAWVKYNMGAKAPPLTSIRLNYTGLGATCAERLYAAVTGTNYAPGSVHCVAGRN